MYFQENGSLQKGESMSQEVQSTEKQSAESKPIPASILARLRRVKARLDATARDAHAIYVHELNEAAVEIGEGNLMVDVDAGVYTIAQPIAEVAK